MTYAFFLGLYGNFLTYPKHENKKYIQSDEKDDRILANKLCGVLL
jgi:hypothetical protein